MEESLPKTLLTAKQAAKILGIHGNTLRRLPIPYYRIGRDRRYDERDLKSFLNDNQH